MTVSIKNLLPQQQGDSPVRPFSQTFLSSEESMTNVCDAVLLAEKLEKPFPSSSQSLLSSRRIVSFAQEMYETLALQAALSLKKREVVCVKCPGGEIYQGEVCQGERDGYGILQYPKGDRYQGAFIHNKPSGFGCLETADKVVYQGQFIRGTKGGFGASFWPNGDRYVGERVAGQRCGYGAVVRPAGEGGYVGQFARGAPCASGCRIDPRRSDANQITVKQANNQESNSEFVYSKIVDPYGTRYEGAVLNGEPHGTGVHLIAEGAVYVGHFSCGKKHGQGAALYPDKSCYVGNFQEGERHGQGVELFVNGCIYVGQFSHGKRSGEGAMWYLDKSCYTGTFLDGQRHGKGTHRFADGRVLEGEFLYDKEPP